MFKLPNTADGAFPAEEEVGGCRLEERVALDRQCRTANLRMAVFLRCRHSLCSLSISANALREGWRELGGVGVGEEVESGMALEGGAEASLA